MAEINCSLSLTERITGVFYLPVAIYIELDHLINTIRGISVSVFAIITYGQSNNINKLVGERLTNKFTQSIPRLFTATMYVVNPKFKTFIAYEDMGVIQRNLIYPINQKATSLSEKGYQFSRLLFVGYAVFSIAGRIADLAVGIFGAALSIFTLGCVARINKFTLEQLSVFGIIDDICSGIQQALNPLKYTEEDLRPLIIMDYY